VPEARLESEKSPELLPELHYDGITSSHRLQKGHSKGVKYRRGILSS